MPAFGDLLGRWTGGPVEGGTVLVSTAKDGVTHGEWEGKSKGKAGFEGKLLKKGKVLRGFWFDNDINVTVGNRFTCTCEVSLDEQDDPSGNTMVCKFKTKDGGSGEWKAKRFSETGNVPRVDRKISSFNFRNKAVFERVSEFSVEKRSSQVEKLREELLATEPHMQFDGASMYVPPPGVGAEYLSVHDMDRAMRRAAGEQNNAYRARLTRDLEAIKALANDGEKLKKRFGMDADIAKRFVDIYEKLIKGEAQYDTLMTDRHAFVPSLSAPTLESSKFAEHMGEPYFSDVELQREIAKRDKAFMGNYKARVEAQIAWLEKNKDNAEALKKRALDGDVAKRKLEIFTKLVRGETQAAKLVERPAFKPNNPDWHPDSSKPAEHLPDKYFNQVDLDRELARRDKAHWEEYSVKLASEIEYLKKIKDDSEKLKKWALDADAASKRVETLTRIVKGQKQEAKLAERPAPKPCMPTSVTRLSGSVMMHPLNIRKAMR